MAISTCSNCDRVFKSPYAFDSHRTGRFDIYPRMPGFKDLPESVQKQARHCMTEEEMLAVKLEYDTEHHWWTNRSDVISPERKKILDEKTKQRKLAKELAGEEEERRSIAID